MAQKETAPLFFPSPFSKAYWHSSIRELKNLRTLTLMALLIGLRVVMSAFFIPLGDNLRIYFHFFISALGGYLCGPVLGLLYGFIADILGFLLFPSGAFFPGYTLSAMLVSFTFGLFLYRSRLSVLRVFLCKLVVNLFCNVGLGALWSAVLYGKGYLFYLARSLGKNLLLLAPEVVLTVLFFRVVLPILEGLKLAPRQPDGTLSLFSGGHHQRIPFQRKHMIQIALCSLVSIGALCISGIRYASLPDPLMIAGHPVTKISILIHPLIAAVILELSVTLCLFLYPGGNHSDDEKKRIAGIQSLRTTAFCFTLLLIILLCTVSLFHSVPAAVPLWVFVLLCLPAVIVLCRLLIQLRSYHKA